MVRERIKRSEPCAHEDCGTRRFYRDDDGYTYCDQGHRQSEQGTVIADDTGELVITGRKQRKKDSDAESIATSRSGFSKPQAFEHYLLCLQLILRKQLDWLIDEKSFPKEIEHIVKDLWALRIQTTRATNRYDSETDDEMRSQNFSSQSEGDITTDAEGTRSQGSMSSRRRRQAHRTKSSIATIDLIALTYVACLLLRLPVSAADLCQWIATGDLLYYYSSKAVPDDLRRRLPGYLQRLLDPESLLHGQHLQVVINKTLTTFSNKYGMQVPGINDTLLLYRWLKLMALPIEVFAAVRRLSKSLCISFDYNSSTKRIVEKLPEVRLMALLVVATKLLFPLDNLSRCAASADDLSALSMDWSAWTISRRSASTSQTENQLSFQDAFSATESACLAMGDVELDQYLDWYQDNIATEHVSERGRAARDADFRHSMFAMFPVSMAPWSKSLGKESVIKDEEDTIVGRLQQAQQRLVPMAVAHEQHSSISDQLGQPGSSYHRYRAVDELLTGEPSAQKLYELAAQLSGVSVGLIIRAVFFIEKKVERQEIVQRHDSSSSTNVDNTDLSMAPESIQ